MCGVAPIVNTRQVGPIWMDNSFGKCIIFSHVEIEIFHGVDDETKQRGLLGILRQFF